jgi:hypothetical protein
MSIESFDRIPEQPEGVAGRPVALAATAAIAMIVVSTLVVWAYMRFDAEGGGRSAEVRTTLIPPTSTFSSKTALEEIRAAQRRRLEGWSWADREHGIVRVPVETAIERYVGSAR